MATLLRAFAQVVLFLLRNRPVQHQILRDHGTIGFVADHDKAFLGPHDVQRFGAVRHDAKLFTRRH